MSALVRQTPEMATALLQKRFLRVLPRIRLHALVSFCEVRCRSKKDDLVCEVIALSWKWFARLATQGKDATTFVSVLASYAVHAVRSGRRVYGQESLKDVFSGVAQSRGGFSVKRLPESGSHAGDPLHDAVIDNTQTPVPDQAAFRQDFPAWVRTRTARDRSIIARLMLGDGTSLVAREFGLSPARVSQLRREFHDDFAEFCGDSTTT